MKPAFICFCGATISNPYYIKATLDNQDTYGFKEIPSNALKNLG